MTLGKTKKIMEERYMRRLLTALIVTLLVLGLLAGGVLAAGPNTVVMNWSGGGTVGTTVTAGDDAITTFTTGGAGISGSFTTTDSNDNPYSYNVDSFQSYLNASVTDGYIESQTDRTDSYSGMYGSAGQTSYSFVGTSGGTASMASRTTTNYAAMADPTYGYQLPGGHNITVSGASSYQINRWVAAGNGDEAGFAAVGDGDAILDSMCSEASGVWALKFGRGCGCYTDASFTATGTGNLLVGGAGHNSVTFNGMGVSATGDGTEGSANLSFIANWLNGSVGINDYSMTVQ